MIVETRSGSLSGERGDRVNIFRGIPYAAAPVGPLRWRAPQPVSAWTGVRDATTFGSDPMQVTVARKRSRAPGISEDCLTLNVWAPADLPHPAPVMVWLEGGSFITGTGASARVDGTGFAQHGVVIVTANYRLGAFGYLAHPLLSHESEHGTSGNYGMLDQLAVLRWVRQNIAALGGDPGNVTVFGVSAGSASIGLMLTMPAAAGLFDKAILQSPGSLRPLCGLAQAEAAGAVAGDDLIAMRAMPADDVLALNPRIGPAVRGLTTPRILRPILDGYVIPKEEADAYAAGDFAHVPMMIGSTAREGDWAVGDLPVNTVAQYRDYLHANFGDALEEALATYPVTSDAEVKAALAAVFGDTQFSYGTRGIARASARYQPKTYRYLFCHGTAGHSDDTSYIFGTEDEATSPADCRTSSTMMQQWVNFATSGDPNGDDLPEWQPFDAAADNFLEYGEDTIAMNAGWRTKPLDFIQRYFATRGLGTIPIS